MQKPSLGLSCRVLLGFVRAFVAAEFTFPLLAGSVSLLAVFQLIAWSVYRFVELLIVLSGNQYAHFIVVLLGDS